MMNFIVAFYWFMNRPKDRLPSKIEQFQYILLTLGSGYKIAYSRPYDHIPQKCEGYLDICTLTKCMIRGVLVLLIELFLAATVPAAFVASWFLGFLLALRDGRFPLQAMVDLVSVTRGGESALLLICAIFFLLSTILLMGGALLLTVSRGVEFCQGLSRRREPLRIRIGSLDATLLFKQLVGKACIPVKLSVEKE